MSIPKKSKIGICTYCGKRKPLSDDHVPPKNLFAKPFPSNLLTVPACVDCNNGFSLDDEYFRIALTITDEAKGHQGRDAILPTVMRGINRVKAKRFLGGLWSQTQLLPRHSPSGIFIGNQHRITFDGSRLDRVARRIVQALFSKVLGRRLPDDHCINVIHYSRFTDLGNISPEYDQALRDFIWLISSEQLTKVGNVFGYRWIQSPNGPSNTMWLLYFFGRLEFYCATYPDQDIGSQS